MTVSSSKRNLLAFLSACGMAVGILAYGESFDGIPAGNILPWIGLLCIGMIALFAPIYALEHPASRSLFFFYKGFARGMPNWVAPCEWVLALVALAHFVWFGIHSGFGVPAIKEGQYVLEARGQVLKALSQAEYLTLRGSEVRMFAAMMISFYFVPMMYWWFSRGRKKVY